MQAFDEQCEPGSQAALEDQAVVDDGTVLEATEGEEDQRTMSEGFMLQVLAAVAEMALRSKRRQADLDAALHYAGVVAGRTRRLAALERLRLQGCVEKVVELCDGGVLLSVTARGLDRLGAIRPR
jgi:hypothetical protein